MRFNSRPEQVVGFCGVPLEKMLRVGVFVACRLAGAEPPAFLPTRRQILATERGKAQTQAASRPETPRKAPDEMMHLK